MFAKEKKLLLSQASAETSLTVLDRQVVAVNPARKSYKEAFAHGVSSKFKPAAINTCPDPRTRAPPMLHSELKFVSKITLPEPLPIELLEEQKALLLQQASTGITSLKVLTDAPAEQVPQRASYKQAVMTPALTVIIAHAPFAGTHPRRQCLWHRPT